MDKLIVRYFSGLVIKLIFFFIDLMIIFVCFINCYLKNVNCHMEIKKHWKV